MPKQPGATSTWIEGILLEDPGRETGALWDAYQEQENAVLGREAFAVKVSRARARVQEKQGGEWDNPTALRKQIGMLALSNSEKDREIERLNQEYNRLVRLVETGDKLVEIKDTPANGEALRYLSFMNEFFKEHLDHLFTSKAIQDYITNHPEFDEVEKLCQAYAN